MSLGRMCGLVLWANSDDQKAVVWCEDQGDLAFYVEPKDTAMSGVALDAGDLIEFELREDRQFRRVTNPTLLVAGPRAGAGGQAGPLRQFRRCRALRGGYKQQCRAIPPGA